MLRFHKVKVAKEKLYGATKTIKIYITNSKFTNLLLVTQSSQNQLKRSKLSNSKYSKSNCKYLTEYLDEVIRPLVLILPRRSGYVKEFKNKDGDKSKNNKLMRLRLNVDKLLGKYKTIQTETKDLKNIE